MPQLSGLLATLEDGWKTQGDTFAITDNLTVITHPADVARVLRSTNYRSKGPAYDNIRSILGNGILSAEGITWKNRRRLINPSFRHVDIAHTTDTIADIGVDFVRALKERSNDNDGPIEVTQEMNNLALATLSGVLFGQHTQAINGIGYATFTDTLKLASKPSRASEPKYLAAKQDFRAALQSMIEASRNAEPDNSLLSRLVHSKDTSTEKPYLNDEEISHELSIIMFAGHDTSALTLTWLFEMIKNRPDITERLQSEVDTVLDGCTPSMQDMSKLTYLNQTINETLRTRPTVPLISRVAEEPDRIGDIDIKPGGLVTPYIWGTHRHPDFWDNPEQFNPDRWENSHNKDAFVPFATGQRMCIGRGLAMSEIAIHGALLLQNLDMKVISADAKPKVRITMRPADPVYATVKPRSH